MRDRIRGFQVELVQGKEDILLRRNIIEELRRSVDGRFEPHSSAEWFLSQAARSRTIPVLAIAYADDVVVGMVFLHHRRIFGLPTGMFEGGHQCGRGAVLVKNTQRRLIVEIVSQALVSRRLAHTVTVTIPRDANSSEHKSQFAEGRFRANWFTRISRNRLVLKGNGNILRSYSYKMRRNIKHHKKKFDRECRGVFLTNMDLCEANQAIETLRSAGRRVLTRSLAEATHATIKQIPNIFYMGLKDQSGNWMSIAVAWREGRNAYLEWQLNADRYTGLSISTVMRWFWIEHEIRRGSEHAIFVGETVGAWSRSCEDDKVDQILAIRTGIVSWSFRTLASKFRFESRFTRLRAPEQGDH